MIKLVNRIYARIRLLFHKSEPYSLYKEILGFYPNDPTLYQLSFLHKSTSTRQVDGKKLNNERLEFLGDSVLQTIISDILYKHFPDKKEGFLTLLRAQIVKRDTVNHIALEMGLDKLTKMSTQGIDATTTSIPGNTLEALVGAIYLDKGYQTCYQFLKNIYIGRHIDLDQLAEQENDYKSKLLEWGQKRRLRVDFEITESRIEERNTLVFTAQTIIAQTLKGGIGEGLTKKKAHQQAARQTFELLKSNAEFQHQIYLLKQQLLSSTDTAASAL